ncbi:MAG: hypothetical protein JSV64_07865 [Candidatus Bathyarchaeota archaeon]|nr:MAG: hypothetical protein JSV64_07865 [Candidatus Bathyarchaeota archaeon]
MASVQITTVRFLPATVDVYAQGQTVTVACVVEEVTDLTALVLELAWDQSKLEYQSHTTTIPVESCSCPIPPSPYAGTLVGSVFWLNDTVDQLGGKYSMHVASLPSTRFNGSGAIVVITFKAIWTPSFDNPAEYLETLITATRVTLVSFDSTEIPYTFMPCVVQLHKEEITYPPLPLLIVDPQIYEARALGEIFPMDVWLLGDGYTGLDPFWDVLGIDVYVNFNATLMAAIDVTLDPDGTFGGFWLNSLHNLIGLEGFEIDNTEGWIHVAFTGSPGSDGHHTPPSGTVRMFSVSFRAIVESATYPPPSTPITLKNPMSTSQWLCEECPSDPYFGWAPLVSIFGFPHPERDFCPWHGHDYPVDLPHAVEGGEHVASYKPAGGYVDLYTQYPYPFGGQGPHRPSDMFWPQKSLVLCANVSYNEWSECSRDVTFQVIDPHGVTWGIYVNRPCCDSVACVFVRMPWPDDSGYYFGVWEVVATVEVAGVVVNDTLTFKYDYRVNIWDVQVDDPVYDPRGFKHGEDISVAIQYGTYAMQNFDITFTVTAVDASGVAFDFSFVQVTIGGAEYCTYKNGTVELDIHVEEWARPPDGTIYAGALSDFPQNGGSAETPAFELRIAILAG